MITLKWEKENADFFFFSDLSICFCTISSKTDISGVHAYKVHVCSVKLGIKGQGMNYWTKNY